MTFEELNKYYKFPLKADSDYYCKIMTDDNQMAFDFYDKISPKTSQDIIDKINSINKSVYTGIFTIYKETIISYFMLPHLTNLLEIRGWGHLTGQGGLKLSDEKAEEVQQAMLKYCINQLNK